VEKNVLFVIDLVSAVTRLNSAFNSDLQMSNCYIVLY